MKLVVGLGNPGKQYANTRHNVGFEVVDYIANGPGVGGGLSGFRKKFDALVAEWQEGSETVLLMKPETFMNLSGQAVRQALDFYKLERSQLLVISDDLALPVGKLRLRAQGSHGGQNGLRSIEQQLGSQEYARLRIGIGSPGGGDAADYVLGKFKPGERPAIEEMVALAAQGVVAWVVQGIDPAMNRVNGPSGSGEPKEKKPKKDKPEKPDKPKQEPTKTEND